MLTKRGEGISSSSTEPEILKDGVMGRDILQLDCMCELDTLCLRDDLVS